VDREVAVISHGNWDERDDNKGKEGQCGFGINNFTVGLSEFG
jgi:hypothetical protein